jgi:plastocyanin
MRKFLVIVVVLVVSSGPACSKSTPSATSESSPASVAVVSETTVACPDLSADNPFVIKIQDMAFEPSCLTAAGSSTIRIVNMDSVAHTFTIDGTQVDVTIDAGQTFNGESAGLEPGEYTFHCTIHPSMTGTITVV